MDTIVENKQLASDLAFDFMVPGKWILAGEHSVLRGSPALVFPLEKKYLRFKYLATENNSSNAVGNDFQIKITGTFKGDLELFIWSVVEKFLVELQLKRENLKGVLEIQAEIPFGAGMGASATLAVGMSQFFHKLGFLKDDLFSFSKKIEDLFHGESSGVDVAVALYQKPMIFQRGQQNIFLKSYNLPQLYISYSGTRGATKDCVDKVKKMLHNDSSKFTLVDLRMSEVVQGFIKNFNQDQKLDQASADTSVADLELRDKTWTQLLDQAQSCFKDWELIPLEASQHINFLKTKGALSCKMTGSGGGGYVLSLWPHDFDMNQLGADLKDQLIKV